MALQFVPGIARVVYSGVQGSTNWANVLHVAQLNVVGGAIIEDPWNQADIDALATFMRTRWTSNFAPQINNNVALTSTTATDLTNITGVVGADLTNVVASLSGTGLPANVATCVSWREGLHYRGGHPRTYLPAPTASQTASLQSWTIAFQNAVELAMNGFLASLLAHTAISAGGLQLVAVHRTLNYADRIPPLVAKITSALVDSRIDTQRRRLGPDV